MIWGCDIDEDSTINRHLVGAASDILEDDK